MPSLSRSEARLQQRSGFTLVEMLVVIATMAILCALSIALFTVAQQFGDGLDQTTKSAMARLKPRPAPRRILSPTNPVTTVPPSLLNLQPGLLGTTAAPLASRRVRVPDPPRPTNQLQLGRTPLAPDLGPPPEAPPGLPPRRTFQAEAAPPGSGLFFSQAAPAFNGNDIVWRTYTTADAFKLHSNPTAQHVIYMDFDGHTTAAGNPWNTLVNGGNPITSQAWSMDANRAAFSTTELNKIIDLWRMVAEDFMPFDVDVTTEDPGAAYIANWGMRAVIGPTPTVSNPAPWAGAGGIAFLFSFKNGSDTVCWCWNGDSSAFPESSSPVTISHEVGHTLGLNHDADPPAGYYSGHGAGVTSWGPIMGAPFGKNVTQWSRNTYPNANNPEDDLQIISTSWGFGYRADDHGDTSSTATALNTFAQGTLTTTYGIIEKSTDADYFSFYAGAGAINIQIDPLPVGPNLDIQADLYDATGTLLLSSNPVNKLDATLATNVPTAGIYYVKITGTGLLPVLPTGYPNYGSLGNYQINGTVVPMPPLATAFKFINPVRWNYNLSTGTYDGTIICMNITDSPLTGSYNFELTFPDGIQATSPSGVQIGNVFTIKFDGTLPPQQPIRFAFQLRNPRNLPLRTGFNTYFTGLTLGP